MTKAMEVETALKFADEWTEGHTFYEGMAGWRVVCATLAAEVRRLRAPTPMASMEVEQAIALADEVAELSAQAFGVIRVESTDFLALADEVRNLREQVRRTAITTPEIQKEVHPMTIMAKS